MFRRYFPHLLLCTLFMFLVNYKTAVAHFITHNLFSNGRRWIGKSLHKSKSANAQGENRFVSKIDAERQRIAKDHSFDIIKNPSRLVPTKQAFVLNYAPYHSKFSLWNTMKDELLIVRKPSKWDGKGGVLLGMGYMGWSGGYLNCSPFFLWIPRH